MLYFEDYHAYNNIDDGWKGNTKRKKKKGRKLLFRCRVDREDSEYTTNVV